METSSPLAAMRPPAPMFGQRGLFRSHAHSHLSANPRGSGTLNLREQFGLQRSYQPYSDSFNSFSNSFNVKAVQGSSPAASLAADLSQNFSITDARFVALYPVPVWRIIANLQQPSLSHTSASPLYHGEHDGCN